MYVMYVIHVCNVCNVCMYVCKMYVCMCVCVYVCICIDPLIPYTILNYVTYVHGMICVECVLLLIYAAYGE